MNAPVDQLAFHVRTYLPDAEGEALEHRINLLKARDYAASLLGTITSPKGYEHARDAHDMAGNAVFCAEYSPAQLKAAVGYCRALVQGALFAERLDAGLL